MPYSAISPRFANAVPNRAESEANRRSQYNVMMKPKPTAVPGVSQNVFAPLIAQALLRDRIQQRHVGARAKSAARAGENDDAHVGIALRLVHRSAHFLFHRAS